MADTPDFEQLARTIMGAMPTGDSVDYDIQLGIADLAEQLRLLWNARGAAWQP